MNVKEILNVKGASVASVAPDSSIATAAALLGEKKIGALLVQDAAGAVVGILSERDIVRALPGDGPAALEQPVSAHMSSPVKTCSLSDSLHDIMAQMTESRIRHLPVVEGGALQGIISIGDVVKHRLGELQSETEALRDYIGGRV